jgi:uncharacterized protein (DUF1778 family)
MQDPPMFTTTIRLPGGLKSHVAAAAKRAGTTAQGFILEAIAERAERPVAGIGERPLACVAYR